MSFSYYIYYRVAHAQQAQALVRHVQSELKNRTGTVGRLLRKRDDPSTWMEIYEGVADSSVFEQCLRATLEATDFTAVLEAGGVRHLECFEDPCA